jgi:signal transduction histidine kinase
MRIKDRKTGVIEALNKRKGDFSEEDAQILTIMASQAAVAIHNAHVFNAMQKANQELRRANDFRQEFIGIASHELRTPLGIILGYVTLLKEEADERVASFANSIFKATLQLRSLVEEMTIMNLLYTGATELKLTPTRIQDLLEATCDSLLEMAEVHKVDINLNAPSLSFWVNADLRLKTAFVNIINNAIRFSPEGGQIAISFVMTDETIRVDIRDNGAGIAPEEIERIFDQFYQVEEHLTRQHGGLGLGLAIARAIVELHGGSVWAESEGLGHGSTFRVLLPRYYPQPQS